MVIDINGFLSTAYHNTLRSCTTPRGRVAATTHVIVYLIAAIDKHSREVVYNNHYTRLVKSSIKWVKLALFKSWQCHPSSSLLRTIGRWDFDDQFQYDGEELLPRRRDIGDVVIGSAHHHFVVRWFNKNEKNERFSLIRNVIEILNNVDVAILNIWSI